MNDENVNSEGMDSKARVRKRHLETTFREVVLTIKKRLLSLRKAFQIVPGKIPPFLFCS